MRKIPRNAQKYPCLLNIAAISLVSGAAVSTFAFSEALYLLNHLLLMAVTVLPFGETLSGILIALLVGAKQTSSRQACTFSVPLTVYSPASSVSATLKVANTEIVSSYTANVSLANSKDNFFGDGYWVSITQIPFLPCKDTLVPMR